MEDNESRLQKDFKSRDVQRMRNLITKNYGDKTATQAGYTKQSVEHKEGDIWEENGKTWTIKNSLKQTMTRLDSIKKSILLPIVCPNCSKAMKNDTLNKKMWPIHKTCFDCVVEYETRLRNDPEAWEKYQKEKMFENAKSFFKDADTDVQELRKILTQELKNVQNADGELEVFNKAMSAEDFDKKVLSEYKLYKKNVLKGLKGE